MFFVVLCGHCDLLTPSFLGHEGHEALHKEHHDIIIVVGDALLNTNEGEIFIVGRLHGCDDASLATLRSGFGNSI